MFLKRLRNLRLHSELTQEQTASKLGLTQATYSRYENGTNEPDLTTLKNIAQLFGCSVDFLLECDDQDNFSDPVELLNLIQNGNFIIDGKFISDKEKHKLLQIIKILYEV